MRHFLLSLTVPILIGLSYNLANAASLVAHYTFDSDVTIDSGTNGLNLTSVGDATLVAGKFGNAVDLDGNDYLWNASTLFDIGGSDFAVAFWYQKDGSSFSPLVGKNSSAFNTGYATYADASNVEGDLNDNVGGVVSEPRPAGDNSIFQHVVYQRSSGFLQLYLNGVLSALTPVVGHASSGNAFAIGSRNISSSGGTGSGGASQMFDGRLDDVRIYTGALSQSEINQLQAVPEPSTLILLGTGLLGLVGYTRRRKAA